VTGRDALRADGTEASVAAFFNTEKLPVNLLPMHSRWLSDALADREHPFIR
jgi:hypothetical protein